VWRPPKYKKKKKKGASIKEERQTLHLKYQKAGEYAHLFVHFRTIK